ncbi:phage tail assembly chaperone [Pseudomonas entomophila]|uniref:Phage tail assembly chaperone n=2 Tax=Pseudomonas entomophila TaxID=312306 RepID=A0ABY9QTR8_9PSED|nr:phage tail assembly chaperone [Pseudomonas entomophila]WMW07421.1 phage tail assembly chaperone [Pseudomonas entomophila]CAK16847.1 putative phage protein [Pseudomonas entomophila L48]
MIFYSAQNQGFYDSKVLDRMRPDDAVEISAELHAVLMRGQAIGKQIVVESNGMPGLRELIENAAAVERGWRDRMLADSLKLRDRHRDQLELGGGAETNLSPEQFHALLTYLQALRDWPQSDAFPDAGKRPVAPDFINESGDGQ